jgi:hypothetical protein
MPMIKRIIILIAVLGLASTQAAFAGDDIKPVPIPIPPKKIDLNGTWNFTSSGHRVTGKCPPGKASSGTAQISQAGSQVSIKYLSGVKCDPAAVCSYTGVIEENQLKVSNHAKVDEEGGEVTNALGLVVMSNKSMNGTSSSRYRHPKNFECHWESQVNFSRK